MLRKWLVLFVLLFLGVWTSARPDVLAASVDVATGRGWLTLQTPHFLIHFPAGSEVMARKIGVIAEETHRSIVPLIKHIPDDKTHVVLAATSDVANASTQVAPYNRIEINPVLPGKKAYESGTSPTSEEAWLKQLFTHEYAHLLHLDLSAGVASQVRQLFGRIPGLATPNVYEGVAVKEGYAVHEESALTGGRGAGTYYDMFLRAAILENRVPKWDQILGNYQLSSWYPTDPAYLFGYSFIDYITRMYGEEKVALVHRYFAERPLEGPNAAFNTVMQEPFDSLWAEWLQDLRQRYLEQVEVIGKTTPLTTIDTVGETALWPEWSPRGDRVLYGSTGTVVPALRLMDKDGPSDQRLFNGRIEQSNGYAWHPDGQEIVYSKVAVDKYGQLSDDLFLYNLSDQKEERLTNGMHAFAPSFSPEGDCLMFLARQGGQARLMVLPWRGGEPRLLWSSVQLQPVSLAWSPTGDQVAMTATDQRGQVDLFILSLVKNGHLWSAGKVDRLTQNEVIEEDPSWSPDGTQLLFSADRGGVYNIHAYDVQSKAFYQVTNVLYGAFAPRVSPDGGTLMLTSFDSEGYHLATMPWRRAEWSGWEETSVKTDKKSLTLPALGTITLTPEEVKEAKKQQPVEGRGLQRRRELAPWERDLMQPVDQDEFVVRRYNALETLAPRYWLPVWGGPDGQWVTGGATSATDALGRHTYSLGVSFGADRASYSLDYEFTPSIVGRGPTFGLALAGSRQNVSEETLEDKSGEAPLSTYNGRLFTTWRWPGALESKSLTLSLQNKAPQRDLGLRLAGVWQRTEGDGPLRVDQRLSSSVSQFLPTLDDGTVAEVEWNLRSEVAGEWSFLSTVAAGVSRHAPAIAIGGEKGAFKVRGFGFSELSGPFGATFSLESRKVLVAVEHGWKDWPLFVQDVELGAFFDAGSVKRKGLLPVFKASLGAEIRVSGNLGRGALSGIFKIGVAQPLDGTTPLAVYYGLGTDL